MKFRFNKKEVLEKRKKVTDHDRTNCSCPECVLVDNLLAIIDEKPPLKVGDKCRADEVPIGAKVKMGCVAVDDDGVRYRCKNKHDGDYSVRFVPPHNDLSRNVLCDVPCTIIELPAQKK